MKIEEMVTAGLTAVVSQAQERGRDVHAVLLMIDVLTGEHALQGVPAQGDPPLCCALHTFFHWLIRHNPDLGRRLQQELAEILDGKPAGAHVH